MRVRCSTASPPENGSKLVVLNPEPLGCPSMGGGVAGELFKLLRMGDADRWAVDVLKPPAHANRLPRELAKRVCVTGKQLRRISRDGCGKIAAPVLAEIQIDSPLDLGDILHSPLDDLEAMGQSRENLLGSGGL